MPKNRVQITKRDGKLLKLLKRPHTAAMLDDLFPSKQTKFRRLLKLRRAGLIHVVGYIGQIGRPQDVYCVRKNWKTDRLPHDLALTRILNHWGIETEMTESHPFPDAVYGDLHFEMDTGSIPLTRVKTHLHRYEHEPIIFITYSENRLLRLLERCSFLEGRLMGVTYEEALRRPAEVILRHTDGDTIVLSDLLKMVLNKVSPEIQGQ